MHHHYHAGFLNHEAWHACSQMLIEACMFPRLALPQLGAELHELLLQVCTD